MRKKIIVGNFKMNMLTSEVAKYCCEVDMTAQKADFLNTIVAITPTYLSIETAKNHSMFMRNTNLTGHPGFLLTRSGNPSATV